MRLTRPAAAAAASALAAGLVGGMPPTGQAPAAAGADTVTIQPGVVHAAAARPAAPTTAYCEQHYKIACYLPGQVEQAYGLPALYRRGITGRGQTIVIVDSYGSPTVRRDLTVFDTAAGLPAPPSLRIIQPAGHVRPYRPDGNREGWAGETDLDVEYAHAVAPGAGILLVETPTAENEGTTGFPQIVTTEQTFPSRDSLLSLRGAYAEAAADGVTVLAASGDSGAADVRYNGSIYYLHRVTSWPDSDPLVTGVGGTQLHLAGAGRPARATVWNDTYNVPADEYVADNKGPSPLAAGGGKSVIFGRPRYQDGVRRVVGDQRGVPDISMSGACNGAADMYQSFAGQRAGWYPACGTSEATPEFAGIVALAGQVAGHPLGLINPALYLLSQLRAPGIVDVVSGDNTVSFRQGGQYHAIRGFRAEPGYDLASGVGTVNAPWFVPELACLAGHRHWSSPRQAAAHCRLP